MTSLEEVVGALAAEGGGTYGVAAKNLATGETVALRADETFNTASVIKVAVMVELFRHVEEGGLRLDDRMELRDEYRAGGSSLLDEFASGLRPTLRDLCVAMIAVSDNTATNMLITRLGIPAINDCMASLGLCTTRLHRLIGFSRVAPGEPRGLGATTPNEMLRLYEGLARGQVVSAEASEQMVAILARQQDRLMIPRFLPLEYDAVARRYVSARIANKTGAVDGVRNDVALLSFPDGRRWIISVLSRDLQDLSWSVDNQGQVTIGRIARAIYDAWA